MKPLSDRMRMSCGDGPWIVEVVALESRMEALERENLGLLDAAVKAVERIEVLEKGVLCDKHGPQTHAECPRCFDELHAHTEELEKENLGLLDAMILHSLPIEKKP